MKQKTSRDEIRKRAAIVRRADRRLQENFAGQYVAYIDTWRQAKSGSRLVRRMLAHSASLKEVSDALEPLSSERRARVVFQYVSEATPGTLEAHYDLPWRL
jgi:hypothetical protein